MMIVRKGNNSRHPSRYAAISVGTIGRRYSFMRGTP